MEWREPDSWVLGQVDWRVVEGVEGAVAIVAVVELRMVVAKAALGFEVQAAALDLVSFLVEHRVLRVCHPRSAAPCSSRGMEEGASFQVLVWWKAFGSYHPH